MLIRAAAIALSLTSVASADDLAGYFGFDPLEVVRIGRGAGPLVVSDMNGDGLEDLVVANNRSSRIEIHYQRANPDPEAEQATRINEFPEHWRYRRQMVPVVHRIAAIVPWDADGDGLMDILYASGGSELVLMRQTSRGVFESERRHRVRDLAANRNGLLVADLVNDEAPEVVAIVDGEIHVFPASATRLGEPLRLSAGADIIAVLIDDLTGNGRADIIGIVPDDPAPVRIWLGTVEDGVAGIGSQLRFEMPPLMEADTVRLPGEEAARLAVIERTTKRIVTYSLDVEEVASTGDRDAPIGIRSFTDSDQRDRAHVVIDLDGDGYTDLLATDTDANALAAFRQAPGRGFQAATLHPSLAGITHVAAGDVDDDAEAEIFVLSAKEGVVGRCDVSGTTIPFPAPLPLPAGQEPTALDLVRLAEGPRVAVIAKDGRDYVLHLIDMEGETTSIDLGKRSRSPETIVALDADQNGRTDLLIFTKDKPMTMVRSEEDGFTVLESDDMGQYGLVRAATRDNIAVVDVDGDGQSELLIADTNFVRAVRYDAAPPAGVSPGWQVVQQINASDPGAKLVSLASLEDSLVAADAQNDRLLVLRRNDRRWTESERLTVRGFDFGAIHAGPFSGDGEPNLLLIGEDGFGVVRLGGERLALRERGAWQSDDTRQVPHEIAAGDVNHDGFMDIVSLDAAEQMCEILTFSETGRLLYAMGFQLYESRIFSGGDAREYEPSQVFIVDVTGDGAADMVMLAHDRILVYPSQKG